MKKVLPKKRGKVYFEKKKTFPPFNEWRTDWFLHIFANHCKSSEGLSSRLLFWRVGWKYFVLNLGGGKCPLRLHPWPRNILPNPIPSFQSSQTTNFHSAAFFGTYILPSLTFEVWILAMKNVCKGGRKKPPKTVLCSWKKSVSETNVLLLPCLIFRSREVKVALLVGWFGYLPHFGLLGFFWGKKFSCCWWWWWWSVKNMILSSLGVFWPLVSRLVQ